MDSRGTINGSEVGALPVNEGTFIVDCAGVVNISTSSALSLVRRAAVFAAAVVAGPCSLLLTARRRLASTADIAILHSAKVARRVTPSSSASVTMSLVEKLTRRVAQKGLSNSALNSVTLVSWRFIRRSERDRVIRTEPARRSIVMPDQRRVAVAKQDNRMFVPLDAEVVS